MSDEPSFGDAVLCYRPWVPRAGMSRTFAELVKAWGDPNRTLCKDWPRAVLEVVCERGAPRHLLYAEDCREAAEHWWVVKGAK